uniref:SGNH hydrolase-type esterase domain-containing protein n=1 Tax=Oryzias sinensis TaxID=183150 RepID=A0A8C7Y8H4_9TELE
MRWPGGLNIRYINAITRCFPGAKVKDLLQDVIRIIFHIGTNDTTLQQSEITKREFRELFTLLSNTGKYVFISGPIPTLTRGSTRFSRILSLHTWLLSTSQTHRFGFIDNFNLFWNHPSFYRPDGLHPSLLGSSILTANIQHTVHCLKED